MVVPVATAILSRHTLNDICAILEKLKGFCNEYKYKWPFFERVITDVSYALFGAVLKCCNTENFSQYLQSCFKYLTNPSFNKRPKVVIQWCKAHYMHIICKDLNSRLGKTHSLSLFLKNALKAAFSLQKLEECKYWFSHIFVILLYPKKTVRFYESYNILKKKLLIIKENDIENYIVADDDTNASLESIASRSPFKKSFLKIYNEVKHSIKYETIVGDNNDYKNEEICNFIINKYCPFIPLWTNIMGILIDPSGDHVSNAPVEYNFFLQKHILLKGKSVRPGEFIKVDRKDNMSSLKELRYKYNIFIEKKTFDNTECILENDSKENSDEDLSILNDHSFLDLNEHTQLEEQWGKKDPQHQKLIIPKYMVNAKNTHTFTTTYEDVEDIIQVDSENTEFNNSSRLSQEHSYCKTSKGLKKGNTIHTYFLFRFNSLFNMVYNRLKQEKIGFYNYLEKEDWESLEKGKELTNLTLDCSLLCIIKENFKNVLSIPCQINEICFEKVNTVALYKPDYILIPILSQKHFTLCILKLKKREFIFFDSLYDHIGIKYFDKFISSTCKEKNWKFIDFPKRCKQNDLVSCGVFVILYAIAYLQGKSLNNLPNPDLYRNKLKALLIKHSDNRSEFCFHCGNRRKTKTKCSNCIYFVCNECEKNIYNNKFSICKICTSNFFKN